MKHYNQSQTKASKRLSNIEKQLEPLYRVYQHTSRHSAEWLNATTKIINLEHERDMLETIMQYTGLKIS